MEHTEYQGSLPIYYLIWQWDYSSIHWFSD